MNCFNFYVRWGVGKKLWFYEKSNQEIRELCNLLVRIISQKHRYGAAFPFKTASDLLVDRFILRISIRREAYL